MLELFPHLKLTADFSHWTVVCERLLSGDPYSDALMRECANRSLHIHARVGSAQRAQVPDPMAMDSRRELRVHERWWDMIWHAARSRGDADCTLTPEYGPHPYNPGVELRENGSRAGRSRRSWEIINEQRERQMARFSAQEATLGSSSRRIPIVDIAPFCPSTRSSFSDTDRSRAAATIHAACKDLGFFYISGHGTDEQVLQELVDGAAGFFALPNQDKERIAISKSPYPHSGRGYQRLLENITSGKKVKCNFSDTTLTYARVRNSPSSAPVVRM